MFCSYDTTTQHFKKFAKLFGNIVIVWFIFSNKLQCVSFNCLFFVLHDIINMYNNFGFNVRIKTGHVFWYKVNNNSKKGICSLIKLRRNKRKVTL